GRCSPVARPRRRDGRGPTARGRRRPPCRATGPAGRPAAAPRTPSRRATYPAAPPPAVGRPAPPPPAATVTVRRSPFAVRGSPHWTFGDTQVSPNVPRGTGGYSGNRRRQELSPSVPGRKGGRCRAPAPQCESAEPRLRGRDQLVPQPLRERFVRRRHVEQRDPITRDEHELLLEQLHRPAVAHERVGGPDVRAPTFGASLHVEMVETDVRCRERLFQVIARALNDRRVERTG